MECKKWLINGSIAVIVSIFILLPQDVRGQGIHFLPKDIIVETYLDKFDMNIMRIKEEERALKALAENQIEGFLSEGLSSQGLVSQEGPKRSILKTSLKFLEDIFEVAQLQTSLKTQVKFNDNVNLDKANTSDWIYSINPSLNLKLTRGLSYLGLTYYYNRDYYLRHTSDNLDTHKLTGTLFYKPSNIFSFQLDELFEGTGAIDLSKLAPFTIDRFNRAHDRINTNKMTAIFTYMPWGRTNLAHLIFTDERAYCDDRSLNSASQNFEVDLERYLNPATSVYFGIGFGKTDYEGASIADANGESSTADKDIQSHVLGFKYDVTNLTKAEAKFSYNFYDYDDGTDDTGYNLNCTLRHKLSNLTNVNGVYTFGLTNSASEDYNRYRTNKLVLSLYHQFTQKLSFVSSIGYTLDKYLDEDFMSSGTAVDKIRKKYEFSFGFSHKLYKWLNLNFSYEFGRTVSDFADENYRNNTCTFGAVLDF